MQFPGALPLALVSSLLIGCYWYSGTEGTTANYVRFGPPRPVVDETWHTTIRIPATHHLLKHSSMVQQNPLVDEKSHRSPARSLSHLIFTTTIPILQNISWLILGVSGVLLFSQLAARFAKPKETWAMAAIITEEDTFAEDQTDDSASLFSEMQCPLRPPRDMCDVDELFENFISYVKDLGIELYPAQEEAILEIFDGKNVILNTPTGSGKSLVAAAMHYKSLGLGRRTVYTCPIKALVNEKFLSLCRTFGPENVGMMTGDASVNRDAPLLCCTAEILSNIALQEGETSTITDVVMDEFHYYSDKERGVAWQTPLLTMSNATFLLMSATMGRTDFFSDVLCKLTGRPTAVVQSTQRPVPLDFEYSIQPLVRAVEILAQEGKVPVYVVHFTQLKAVETAQALTSLNLVDKTERLKITEALQETQFTSPFGKEVRRLAERGIGVHHAGLLPKYRVLMEQLAQKNLLKVICGTDTLGVGVNIPIRTVLLTQLCKFDGMQTRILTAREFHQICGRAGRRGFNESGSVVCQAPEHYIENRRMEQKYAEAEGKKKKRPVKMKPPETGFVNWTEETFRRLINSDPEPLTSQFQVTHDTLLNVLGRPTNGCRALQRIIVDCHESPLSKRLLVRRSFELFRSLISRNIIEVLPERLPTGAKVRVNVDLQEDFSLAQALSLYLLDTLPKLDEKSPTFVLDVITLAEAIVEDPVIILRRQKDKLRDMAMEQMKEEGLFFEERIDKLTEVDYPKPNEEFLMKTFEAFADAQPWVGSQKVLPKSIVREMYEDFMSFNDFVYMYALHRSEGVLLRHVSSVYKVLDQTVPAQQKTDGLCEAIIYLESMIRTVDSSLIDEWTKLQLADPILQNIKVERGGLAPGAVERSNLADDPERLQREFRVLAFEILRAAATRQVDTILERLQSVSVDGTVSWTAEGLRELLNQFRESPISTSLEVRTSQYTTLTTSEREWYLCQTIVDEWHSGWTLEFTLDIEATRLADSLRASLVHFGPSKEAAEDAQ